MSRVLEAGRASLASWTGEEDSITPDGTQSALSAAASPLETKSRAGRIPPLESVIAHSNCWL